MKHTISTHVSIGSLVLLLTACGSSNRVAGIEGSGSPTPAAGVVTIGSITSFGSIFVNGAEYSLTGSSIKIDGSTAAESDLRLGQVVTVIANDDSSAGAAAAFDATSVEVRIAVAGPIAEVDPNTHRFTILGQTLAIDAATQIADKVDGDPLGGLAVGNDVEITGFADSTGVLYARSIEPRRQATPLRITGRVANLDSANRRMQINGQAVDYNDANLTGFEGHSLETATVAISADVLAGNGELHATDVEYVDLLVPGNVGDGADLQGWVTRYVSDTDFDVDGHPITTTDATVMQGPWDENLSLVRLDAFVHVKGKVIANGVVEAAEITTNNTIGVGSEIYRIDAGQMQLTGIFGSELCELEDTAFSIDGVPASWQDIHLGDRGTVHAWFNKDFLGNPEQKCYIVEVEHSVIGRIESVDSAAAALVVNGQRVWLRPSMFLFDRPGTGWDENGVASAGEARAVLNVGDLVAVSGDLTAESDIVASGISNASAAQGYRVTGLARDVDTTQKRLRLGGLLVDYSGARVAGFAGGEPAENDLVTMIASDAPSDGLQFATGLKFAAAPVRGETFNFVSINGLITDLPSADDYAIEGRRSKPLPEPPVPGNGLERGICDPAKLHTNLHSGLLAVGDEGNALPYRIFHFCPAGRHYDEYESLPGVPYGATAIVAPIEAMDAANYSLQVAGSSFGLNPGSTITSAQDEGGVIHTAPLRLEDLHVGDRVRIELPRLSAELALIDTLWAGPAIAGNGDGVQGAMISASEPDVMVSGFTIRTTPATTFNFEYWEVGVGGGGSGCRYVTDSTAADFWAYGNAINADGTNGPLQITARGTFAGNILNATSIDIVSVHTEEWECSF